MSQQKPIRSWNSTPFSMGPRMRPGNQRRVARGVMQPTLAPQASQPVPPPEPVIEPRVVCTAGGPVLCYGISVETPTGGLAADGGKPIALCACGRSKTKPACDGSHVRMPRPKPEEPEAV